MDNHRDLRRVNDGGEQQVWPDVLEGVTLVCSHILLAVTHTQRKPLLVVTGNNFPQLLLRSTRYQGKDVANQGVAVRADVQVHFVGGVAQKV